MSKIPDIVMDKIANRLETELVNAVPVDTGLLKRSINVSFRGDTIVIRMVEYGLYVEFGTVNQRPNPFIRNTIQTKMQNIIDEEIERYYAN